MLKLHKCVMCVALLLVVLCGCNRGDKHLLGMIPEDATVVARIDVEKILSEGDMLKGGKPAIPDRLKAAIDENEESAFSQLLRVLPRFGLDVESNVYVFFTNKTFRYVVLARIDDEDAAKQLIERETGLKFKKMHDRDFLHYLDYAFVIDDGVLFYGKANRSTADNVMGDAAVSILNKNATSIDGHEDIMACLDADAEVNAWLNVKGITDALKSLPAVSDAMRRSPGLMLLTDIDVDALGIHLKLEKESAKLTAEIKAGKSSDYVRLLETTLAGADNSFLKAIPSSMQYVIAASVNGEALVNLEQVNALLKRLSMYPQLDELDVRQMLASINGPLAIAVSPSYMPSDNADDFAADLNVTIAAKTKDAEGIIAQIKQFASSMGQPDYFKNGRHVYNYGGKPLLVGAIDDIVYLTRLDHELLEGNYFDDYPDCKDRFGQSALGLYVQSKVNDYSSFFNFGLSSPTKGDGLFYTADENDNVVLALLSILTSIKMPDHDEDDFVSDYDL